MNGQLALALLALGSIKTGLIQAFPVAGRPASERPATAAAVENAPDPIAFLAREWLARR